MKFSDLFWVQSKNDNDVYYEGKHTWIWGVVAFLFAVIMFLASIVANAQEKTYNFKVAAAYTANQFEFDPNEFAEYINGYQVDLAGRIAGKKTILYGVFNFERKHDVLQLPEYTYDDLVQRDTSTYSFGARLSHTFGVFEPHATALVGFRQSTDVQPDKFDRRYQLGGDVNLRYFFLRIAYQLERVTGNEGIEQGYIFGGGFRF